jgi:hypothetical protein
VVEDTGTITGLDFECTAQVVGSVETYLKVYYDFEDPELPGERYVYTGPVKVVSNEVVTVAADYKPVAVEWYYKPVGELGEEGTLVTPEPPPDIVLGDYQLGHVCGAVPDPAFVPIDPIDTALLGEPFNGPHVVPGSVEAEDFDVDGYIDLSVGNSGDSTYRPGQDVDIKVWGDEHVVGFVQVGEMLQYTIAVNSDGGFDLAFHVLSPTANGRFRVEIDGVDYGEVEVPLTGEWNTDSWEVVQLPGVVLTRGYHVVKLHTTGENFDINRFEVLDMDCSAEVEGSVELLAKAYYLHEDPAAAGMRFAHITGVLVAENEFVDAALSGSPLAVEWYYRPYGVVHAANGDFELGYTCGSVPTEPFVLNMERSTLLLARKGG